MAYDKELEFAKKRTAAANGNQFSEEIDLGTKRNLGPGKSLDLVFGVNADFAAGNTVVTLQGKDTEGANFADVQPLFTINAPKAGHVSRTRFGYNWPNHRFLRLKVATPAAKAGALYSAAIVEGGATLEYFESGYEV